ncbi:MAG: tetratricopeptide repeat protein [Pseudomonadota bacterium]
MFLVACDTAEERAEGHFERSEALLSEGDVDRAIVELRNVLDLNPRHIEARLSYAQLARERGRLRDAYRNFQAASEQDPVHAKARQNLAELAILLQRWPDAQHHSARAAELAPDDPRAKAVTAVVAYREAIELFDDAAQSKALERLRALLGELDDKTIVRQILIDDAMRAEDFPRALAELDAALAEGQVTKPVFTLKLSVLEEMGRTDAHRALLETLVADYPEDESYAEALLRAYRRAGDPDAEERLLQRRVDVAEGDALGARVELLSFVRVLRGDEAALSLIADWKAAGVAPDLFGSLRASILFDAGQTAAAMAEIEGILADTAPSHRLRDIEVMFARMLGETGDGARARNIVDRILEADPGHVAALKLRAGWLIDEGDGNGAVIVLRRAMDGAPRDPEVMTLTANAHLANGNRRLAGEMLALAVETSDSGAKEALLYASFLRADGNRHAAEAVLAKAREADPGNADVLAALGDIHVEAGDWPKVETLENALAGSEDPRAEAARDALQVARLRAQNRDAEAIALLEEIAKAAPGRVAAQIAVVRAQIAHGNLEAAQDHVAAALAGDPAQPQVRLMQGIVLATSNRPAAAADVFYAILREDPADLAAWRALYSVHRSTGNEVAAREALAKARAVLPDAPALLWLEAGAREDAGDVAGAIAAYEALHAQDPLGPIVANNLASLLARHRDDDAALNRAAELATLLKGHDVPAFEDTLGWIAYRQGAYSAALDHLTVAVAGLPDDPMVHYHLAKVYQAQGADAAALTHFRKAATLASADDPRRQIAEARAALAAQN